MKRVLVLMCLIACSVLYTAAAASVPPMINYQGKLMQPSGAPVPDGTYSIRFAIYDVPTGGEPLWSETNQSVQVKGGLFATMLGSVVNLPANIFDSPNRFFGVKVGNDPEMTPRQQIASVGFAVKAGSADIAATVLDGAITNEKIANESVTETKLVYGAITTDKIADLAVSTAKIGTEAVTTVHIAPRAVTGEKMEAQQAWIPAALMNGWVNFGPVDYPMGYMKDSLGFVHILGQVKSGTVGNVPVFILPPGYRPAYYVNYIGNSMDTPFCGTICANGQVQIHTGPGGDNWYVINVTFKAEQ